MGMQWSWQPWSDLQAEYSDNLLLIPGRSDGTETYGLNAGLRVRAQDERDTVSLLPSVQETRYAGFQSFDSNTEGLDGEWSRSSEHGKWQLGAGWVRDSTLNSELAVSGLVSFRQRALRRHLAPSFSYTLTDRTSVAVDLTYMTVHYPDAGVTGLTDYSDANASLSWSYRWSELSTVGASLYSTRYEAARIGNRVSTYGGQIQLTSTWTERWSSVVGAGIYTGVGEGWLLDANLVRQDAVGQWSFALSRTVDPSGTGVLVQQDLVSIGRQQALSPLWQLNMSASMLINRDLQILAPSRDRHYRSAALSISRTLAPKWKVEAGYAYDRQRYSGQSGSAERNAFSLSVHYSGNG